MSALDDKLIDARNILVELGLPKPQLNERTALCLLSLVDIKPNDSWSECTSPLMGITPIMDWCNSHYKKYYAPNSRETFRRQSIHQFIEAGLCLYNPDDPLRPVNSPKTVYQIEGNLLALLKTYKTDAYVKQLKIYLSSMLSLADKYASERDMNMIPVKLKNGTEIKLSAGEHSGLIKQIVENFASRYAPGSELVYVGDTGAKHGYFDVVLLKNLGIELNKRGKLPDVVIYYTKKNWLILIESVTSHGPVDAKRYNELSNLFKGCKAGLVYVSAFPTRKTFLKYLEIIAWETEVWIADAPTHMIHFNGTRFLGPYDD